MGTTRQDDFSAGVVDIDRAGVLSNAVFEATNVIVDGEAALRRRGSTRAYGSDRADLVWVWHGVLSGGRRTVMWDTTDGFCVLADDSSGLPGGAVSSTAYGSSFHGVSPSAITEPPPHAVLGGILFVAPRVMYAGSRKSAAYSAASTVTTAGSRTVTKAAGGFTANVDAGMLMRLAAGGRYYVVESVESDTSLTLTEAAEFSNTATHDFTPVGDFTTTLSLGAALPTFSLVAAVAGRLVTVDASGTYAGQVRFSEGPNPSTGASRWHDFASAVNRHPMPAGAEAKALANLRDRLFVFTTEGVYVISNMAYEIVDFSGNPQHRVELYTKDVKALTQASIATWRDALIVPGFEDIVLLDGSSAPVPISRGVRRAWRETVASAKPGQPVVFSNHLALPVDGDVWLFKLDTPVPDDDGPVFPMTKWTGGALDGTTALALRPVDSASLPGGARVLAANAALTGIFDLLPCFLGEPAADATAAFVTQKADHAGAADTYISRIVSRDFALGDAREGLLRRVQLWYTLSGLVNGTSASGVNGVEVAAAVGGSRAAATFTAESTAGPASEGKSPVGWQLTRQGERVRLEIELGGDCTEFVLHGLQLTFRESQRAY